jgi:Double zinc ribbon
MTAISKRSNTMSDKLDPNHENKRNLLRGIGIVLLLVGLGFTITGLVSFFSAFSNAMPRFSSGGPHSFGVGSRSSGGGPPKLFWCAFIGLPLLGIGVKLTFFSYMGAIGRYVAGESAPVVKDTFNYMAHGTKDGIKTVASALGEGLSQGGLGGGVQTVAVRCQKCNHTNKDDAKFCNDCGAPLLKSKGCPSCEEINDNDAKFCDNCGHQYDSM